MILKQKSNTWSFKVKSEFSISIKENVERVQGSMTTELKTTKPSFMSELKLNNLIYPVDKYLLLSMNSLNNITFSG